jgi:hypothetical protein
MHDGYKCGLIDSELAAVTADQVLIKYYRFTWSNGKNHWGYGARQVALSELFGRR